jgi:hypothetical protein
MDVVSRYEAVGWLRAPPDGVSRRCRGTRGAGSQARQRCDCTAERGRAGVKADGGRVAGVRHD